MKKVTSLSLIKIVCTLFILFHTFPTKAVVPEFDNDKQATSYNTEYTQTFNTTWDNTKFYNQWDMVDFNSAFSASDITSGYLQFAWIPKRILRSKVTYTAPYEFSAKIDYSAGSSRGGIVIRTNAVGNIEDLQESASGDPGFNREGIAFYPTDDGLNMIVQFTGVANGATTPVTRIQVPKPTEVTSLKVVNGGTLKIEDFGTSIYVYYNGSAYIRINLSGKTGNIYTSGTVYDANMQVVGTFTGMEVEEMGKVAIAQRDAALRLYNVTVKTNVNQWVEPTATSYNTEYTQSFNATWDGTKFNGQWDVVDSFSASDIASGYLQFIFPEKRILRSKTGYTSPYEITAKIDYSAGSSRGGIVIRAQAVGNIEDLQEPATSGAGFNREGIAFYPTDDGLNMIVQFTGAVNGYSTPVTKIQVPKPNGITSLRAVGGGTLRIYDLKDSIYVYYNDAPYIRIDLGGKTGSTYTSGTVYNANMQVVGTFSGMEVEAEGKIGIAQRDAAIRLYNVTIKAKTSSLWIDPPATTYNTEYNQSFSTTWDGVKFNNQWSTVDVFVASDIVSGYLQFVFPEKRILRSKTPYVTPYSFTTLIDYSAGSNRGGIIIRAEDGGDIEDLQVTASGDPGFNREGIAFYPSLDGTNMIVQFTGMITGNTTPVTRIQVPKPTGVTNLKAVGGGTLRIEDFGTSIYVYYNDAPYIRIDLSGKSGNIYTSGTVYTSNMEVAGTFSGMEVVVLGKVGIAQRDAAIRLYNVVIKCNDLEKQTINFDIIGKKKYTDPPFNLSAAASSGLPVNYELISGPATLSGNTVTLTGEIGIVTISANQSGNSIYYPAPEVIQSFYVGDVDIPNIQGQDYVDNWVATDALGRQLPFSDDVRSKQNDKYVGVFYYTWHGFHGQKVNDITKIIANYPSDPLSASNPGWGTIGADHFWGEPETGFQRAEDPWVLRRDLQMLSNAQVDFIYIDATNSFTYIETVKTLCQVSMQMRKEGINTPQIIFTTNSFSGKTMNKLYDEFYAFSLFDDLWFKWEGKPLILGIADDPDLRVEVKNFFTIKYSWAWTDTKNKPNHWQWLDTYPQDYGWSTDPTVPEQIVVSVASHPTRTMGSSYHNNSQPLVNNQYVTDFTGQGLHFAEQWTRALEVDPKVIMVTQWNEWFASRFIWDQGDGIYAGRPIKNGDSYFVDAFTEEFNRDMVPMKGGHTDNYYYQLIANIRKFKGMSAPQVFSTPTTIDIDGDFSQWTNISPVFKDPLGDTMHRNFRGYDPAVTFVNNTGRNDIIESRATYDNSNVYLYAKTAQNLTAYSDTNWMLLYIDADRNKGTGWEGYDYVVNTTVISATETTLKKWDGKTWTNEITIPYKMAGNELQLSLPRAAVMMENNVPEFYFHWADNTQKLNDIASFFTEGESAPDRRFNFNFSSSKSETIPQTAFKSQEIPGIVEFEDFDNGGAGLAYADATIGNTGGAYRPTESVDIESKTDGGYNINWINSGEWLAYTVDIKAIGKFSASINYSADENGKEAILYVDGVDKSGVITFPSSGGLTTWASKSLDIQLAAGKHILKFLVKNASDNFKLDKITFTEKDVVYPGNGTGLNKSIWSAPVGGRTWFKDSICSEIDTEINHTWADVSPGCSVSNDFWNIRWQGQVQSLYTETYTFYLTMNDLGRVWINNQLIVDAWNSSYSGTTVTGTVEMTAGQKVPIKVDFAEKSGDAYIKLEWSSASNAKEVVPQSQLFPLINPNGINDMRTSNFSVYPNPANDKLTINSDSYNVESVKITDLQGRVVYTNNLRFIGEKTIDLNLQKGIYFIKLTGNTPFKTQKLIVQKQNL